MAVLADKVAAEEQLATATEEHDVVSSRLAGVLSALQNKCSVQQERLREMAAAAGALEAEEGSIKKVGHQQQIDPSQSHPVFPI